MDWIQQLLGGQQRQEPWSVNSALTQNVGLPSQAYQGGTPGAGDFTMGGQGVFDGNNGQGIFGNTGMEQLGQMAGIGGDLFGMYNQWQAMDMAKNQMKNNNRTSNYNMANNTNFLNSTADVFGSNQNRAVNQFATS